MENQEEAALEAVQHAADAIKWLYLKNVDIYIFAKKL